MRLRFVLVLALIGCSPAFPENHSPNVTAYPFRPTGRTPGGIAVDDPGAELDLVQLDQAAAGVLACLGAGGLPESFGVKVAPDWVVSTCSGEQVFPCDIGPEGCWAKGLTPTGACPCRCRAVVQDQRLIVTVPRMTVLPGRLVTLLTGVENPWADAELAPCVGGAAWRG